MNRNGRVRAFVAVDDSVTDIEAEAFGTDCTWYTVPPEILEQMDEFLRDPSIRVRRQQPERIQRLREHYAKDTSEELRQALRDLKPVTTEAPETGER